MTNPIIQSLWVGKELSLVEQLSIASFIRNGHEFHLYVYNEVAGVPNGTQIKNANEIIPEKDVFTYRNGSYAGFADWFRWVLLYKKGHFWVDTDVICLKPFEFGSDIIFGLQSENSVAVGVLGFPPHHALCELLMASCDAPNLWLPYDMPSIKLKKLARKTLNRGRSNIGWGESGGPTGFTRALKHFELLSLAKPFTYFYPIDYSNWNAVFDDTLANDVGLFSNTYAIHLWNEMMRLSDGFDKNAQFPKNSLFEQLKSKYL